MKEISEEDIRVLNLLNTGVDDAIRERSEWLDLKVNEYAELSIGDEVYDLQTGHLIGMVVSLNRHNRGGVEDKSISFFYKIERADDSPVTIVETGTDLTVGSLDKYIKYLEEMRNSIDAQIQKRKSDGFARQAKEAIDKIRQKDVR